MDRELPSPAARADMLEAEEMLDPTFPRICVLPIYVGRGVKADPSCQGGLWLKTT